MRRNMPVALRGWEPKDEEDPTLPEGGRPAALEGFQGVMYRGKWLISPERQEKTMRLLWVSLISQWVMDISLVGMFFADMTFSHSNRNSCSGMPLSRSSFD
jgi:hypothetical protein